jgi:hypothetical protein
VQAEGLLGICVTRPRRICSAMSASLCTTSSRALLPGCPMEARRIAANVAKLPELLRRP